MPLFREWTTDPYSLAAIWQIEEPESFFIERTGIGSPDIKSEKRRLERLAGRFLLKYLEQDFPLLNIRPDEHDKPRVDDNRFYFSISHSYPYVAAIVSPWVECGIDIQVWHHRMEQLQHKFLSDAERQYFQNDPRLLTLAWSAKEAVYKWQGRRGVEFIDHLPVTSFLEAPPDYTFRFHLPLPQPALEVTALGFTGHDFACAWVIHDKIFHPVFPSR